MNILDWKQIQGSFMKLWVGDRIEGLANEFTFIRNLNDGLDHGQKANIEILVVNLSRFENIESLLMRLHLLSESLMCPVIVITDNNQSHTNYLSLELIPEKIAKDIIE